MLGQAFPRAGGEGVAEDEMVGWCHQLSGHEFEQTMGDVKDSEVCPLVKPEEKKKKNWMMVAQMVKNLPAMQET